MNTSKEYHKIMHCSIILINWNGWTDTIECLESILKQDYKNIDIILIDNNSSDKSIFKIKKWALGNKNIMKTKYKEIIYPLLDQPLDIIDISLSSFKDLNIYSTCKYYNSNNNRRLFFLLNPENSGFAIGNNYGIKFAIDILKTDFCFILNNDTIIKKDTISKLVSVSKKYPLYSAFQPSIYFYDYPEKIWNIGGIIFPWLQTRYFKKLPMEKVKKTDFITGCALFLPINTIKKIGMFTDIFFHGEEDLEYSLRLKKNSMYCALVRDAVVLHKIGIASHKQWKQLGESITNHALNRIVHMKIYNKSIIYIIWKKITLLYYVYLMLYKYKLPLFYSIKLIKKISVYTKKLYSVNREDVKNIMRKLND